ncbi:MAG: DUF998 domain-containing protein [Acidobacteriota bacterium]
MTDPLPRAVSTPARLILGGLAPIPFLGVVILQAALQTGYSHVAHPISALAAFPLGWIQNINFYFLVTFTIAYAIGVHSAISPSRRGVIGPALFGLGGVGLILCGVFPWTQENGILVEPAGHAVAAITLFLGMSLGHMVISGRMRRDPAWTSLASYVRASGILMLLLFFAVAYSLEPGSPLAPSTGLLQRVLVVVWTACTSRVALRGSRMRVNATVRPDPLEAQR